MTMTQAEALTKLRLRLDETVAHVWTDAELRGYLNEVIRDIARRTESLRSQATFTALDGIAQYKCPASCFRIHHIEYVLNDTTYTPQYVDRHSMSNMWGGFQDQQGIPAAYTFWGYPPDMKLQFFPVPGDQATVTVFYYKVPTELSTGTTDVAVTLEIPEGWDDVVLDGAESKALRKGRDQRWQEAEAIYQQHISEMMDTTMRFTDQTGQIAWDGTPAWLTAFEAY